jgi:quercetin dioxygenase-like cupin family protein
MPPPVDVVDLATVAGAGGVVLSFSPGGFHANLVVLSAGEAIAPHRNDEVDVLVVVLAGSGRLTIDGGDLDLSPSAAVVVPRGTTRGVTAGDGLRYLTVHAERRPLGIGGRRPG